MPPALYPVISFSLGARPHNAYTPHPQQNINIQVPITIPMLVHVVLASLPFGTSNTKIVSKFLNSFVSFDDASDSIIPPHTNILSPYIDTVFSCTAYGNSSPNAGNTE